MDNYFQYLLFLFIIISLLSSFFKKKDKPESKPGGTTPKPPVRPQSSSTQENYDILNEIENMFKTQSPQPKKQPRKTTIEEKSYKPSDHTEDPEWHREDPEWHEEDPKWHEENPEWHEENPSEHRLENWDERRKKAQVKLRQNLNQKILKEAKMFEKSLTKNTQVVDARKNLIKKIKQPSTLKEYVIISEILGKPKAFQE
jgi:hypothetical protein